MSNKSPAFQFYPGDFLSDPNTMVMSAEEIGVYWLLVCACWQQKGLSKEFKILSRLARVQEKKFIRMWNENISKCFYFDEISSKFKHNRLEKEIKKQSINSEERKKAAEKRWGNKDASAMQMQCKSNANECLSSSSSTSVIDIKDNVQIQNIVEPARPNPLTEKILEVFEFWKKTMSHPGAGLDDKRKRQIGTALKNYSVEQLNSAITGCSLTAHNMGDNDRGQRYDSLNVILRNADQIDRFIQNSISPPKQQPKANNYASGKNRADRIFDHFKSGLDGTDFEIKHDPDDQRSLRF